MKQTLNQNLNQENFQRFDKQGKCLNCSRSSDGCKCLTDSSNKGFATSFNKAPLTDSSNITADLQKGFAIGQKEFLTKGLDLDVFTSTQAPIVETKELETIVITHHEGQVFDSKQE